jgi:hypothetical protein
MEAAALILWVGGISFTGFCFLAGWMWYLNTEMGKRVKYEWLEQVFKMEIQQSLDKVGQTADRIEEALLGTLNKEGIITRLKNIEKNCELHREIKKMSKDRKHSDSHE